jgi:hypothetical protein
MVQQFLRTSKLASALIINVFSDDRSSVFAEMVEERTGRVSWTVALRRDERTSRLLLRRL